jgi:hypothetical protein
MEFSSLQIVVTVVLILGAAGVALLCDFLKRKNDQLREEVAGLQVRIQGPAQLAASSQPTVAMATAGPAMPPPLPTAKETPVEVRAVDAVGQITTMVEDSVVRPAAIARNHERMNGRGNAGDRDAENLVLKSNGASRTKAPIFSNADSSPDVTSVSGCRQSPPASVSQVQQIKSEGALVAWLNRQRSAAQATTSMAPEPEVLETAAPEFVGAPEPVILPEPVIDQQRVSQNSVTVDSALWESLVGVTPIAPPPLPADIASAPETKFELIQGAASTSNPTGIPAGMFDKSALMRVLESKHRFSGLAVSIGINENDGSAPRSEDLLRSTSIFISGLLHDGDFGCQSGDDEFLMLCPGPQGAQAQRRLSQIAERLWDFQLRGIGTFSILFSWGGLEVNDESLSDAVASAAERMYQTKRSRKTVSMESVSQRRKAV